jgi:hypothetical protein
MQEKHGKPTRAKFNIRQVMWKKNAPVTQKEDFFRQAVPHASLTKLSTQIIVLGSWNLESPYRDRDNTPILACGARPTPCLLDLMTKFQNHWLGRIPGAWSTRQKLMLHQATCQCKWCFHTLGLGMQRNCGTTTVQSASEPEGITRFTEHTGTAQHTSNKPCKQKA